MKKKDNTSDAGKRSNRIKRELHEILYALYGTLRNANNLMEKSGKEYRYNIDRVEIELPIRMEYVSEEQKRKHEDIDGDGEGDMDFPTGFKVSLPEENDVSETLSDDLIMEKKLNAEFGRIKILFNRDRCITSG
ncbi:hypothetical protein H0A36_20580 [Endozoicomonas sp. SM1973]|uniref:Uncharacterized protein n=1 Tax=Spartinivicinus marinus TaxID=2994442 RepID=A0A853IL18_9GAMM|nr:hypothetical protein [Spartinivicinus marinus]MCX4028217.1 hypothetical protein [Spartinivicinus marinus]NYZ68416.1 hypothetical protein [Spartinivicinus marinus]